MFKTIKNWFLKITGNSNCNSMCELIAYIKQGDLDGLNYWVSNKIWYKSDTEKRNEWQNLDMVMRDKVSDCEEKACIRAEVISTWPGWDAQIIVTHTPSPGNSHAVCSFEGPKVRGVMDDSRLVKFPLTVPLNHIIKENWPKAVDFVVCDKFGYRISEVTPL